MDQEWEDLGRSVSGEELAKERVAFAKGANISAASWKVGFDHLL